MDSCRINAGSAAGDHQAAAGTDLCADAPGSLQAVAAGLSGSHHANKGPFLPPGKLSPVVQHHRGMGNVFQFFRVRPVAVAQNPDSLFLADTQNLPCLGQILLFQSFLLLRIQAPGQLFPAAVVQFLRGGEPLQKSCLLIAAKPGKQGKPNPVQQHSPHPYLSLLFHLPHHNGGRHRCVQGFAPGIHGNNQLPLGRFQNFLPHPLAFAANYHSHLGQRCLAQIFCTL